VNLLGKISHFGHGHAISGNESCAGCRRGPINNASITASGQSRRCYWIWYASPRGSWTHCYAARHDAASEKSGPPNLQIWYRGQHY